MYAIEVYNDEQFLPFNFEKNLHKIYRSISPKNTIIYGAKRYFAMPSALQNQIGYQYDFIPIEQEFINNHGITLGIIKQNDSLAMVSTSQFISALITEECIWIRHFLQVITTHLHNREVEGSSLTNFTNVRILIGKTVQLLEEINSLENGINILENSYLEYIQETISNACNYLAKLSGGRAFLKQNVIEMLCTFEVINLIYLAKGDSSEHRNK